MGKFRDRMMRQGAATRVNGVYEDPHFDHDGVSKDRDPDTGRPLTDDDRALAARKVADRAKARRCFAGLDIKADSNGTFPSGIPGIDHDGNPRAPEPFGGRAYPPKPESKK